MSDFFSAAFPWIVMGLCAAILCARLGQQNIKGSKVSSFMTEGMVFGLILGTAVGKVVSVSAGTSLSLGILIGMTVGSLIPEKEE